MWHHYSRGQTIVVFKLSSKTGKILRGRVTEGGEERIQVKGIGLWGNLVDGSKWVAGEGCTCAPGGWFWGMPFTG